MGLVAMVTVLLGPSIAQAQSTDIYVEACKIGLLSQAPNSEIHHAERLSNGGASLEILLPGGVIRSVSCGFRASEMRPALDFIVVESMIDEGWALAPAQVEAANQAIGRSMALN